MEGMARNLLGPVNLEVLVGQTLVKRHVDHVVKLPRESIRSEGEEIGEMPSDVAPMTMSTPEAAPAPMMVREEPACEGTMGHDAAWVTPESAPTESDPVPQITEAVIRRSERVRRPPAWLEGYEQ